MIEIESLLTEASEAPPCGPDLSFDPTYLQLEDAARGKPERQMGKEIKSAEPPIWKDVLQAATALLHRSKDLRIAMHVTRAFVHVYGFEGLAPALRLTRGLVERFGPSLHPRIDPDDGDDPTIRVTALAPLSDPRVLLRDVRDSIFLRAARGTLTVRDIEVSAGRTPPLAGATVYTQAQVDGMLREAAADASGDVRAFEAYQAAKDLASCLDEFFGPVAAPDLKPLLATLHVLAEAWKKHVATTAPPVDPETPPGSSPSHGGALAQTGVIRSREDAVVMIDRIVEYLEKNEPTNPAALMLRRGKRFMTMNFLDIVKEISPESVSKLETVIGPGHQLT